MTPELLASRNDWLHANALDGGCFLRRMRHAEVLDPPLIIPIEVMFVLVILQSQDRRN